LLLLVLAAILAMRFGPFGAGDGWQALLTGMMLVAAMAIQTTAHRIHLGSTPPTTMMTGTTTQIMIDIADLLRGAKPEEKAAMKARLGRMGAAVGGFALGCALAAALSCLLAWLVSCCRRFWRLPEFSFTPARRRRSRLSSFASIHS